MTELVNPGSGAFAGITGTVSATNALLRLRVRQDTTAAIANPAGIAGVGYELYNNAALTLTGERARVRCSWRAAAGSTSPPTSPRPPWQPSRARN